MKKLIPIFISTFVLLLSVACQRDRNTSTFSTFIDDVKRTVSYNYNSNGEFIDLKYSGDIVFNEEETAIQSLSPRAYLDYRKNGLKLSVESNAQGKITYILSEQGNTIDPNSAEGKKIIATIVNEMILNGIDAKGSVIRLYKKGGSEAVFMRVEKLSSDYAKGIYLDYLLKNQAATAAELTSIAQKTGNLIDSDFEKAQLLRNYTVAFLKYPESAKAYFEAASSIDSDFEKANVLQAVVKQGNLDEIAFESFLNVVDNIDSDFEKGQVLKAILQKSAPAAHNFNQLLSVVGRMDSDFEKANVLEALFEKDIPQSAEFDKLVSTLGNIDSDYEASRVLQLLASQNLKSETQWISLINAASGIESEYEKSNVLLQVAAKMIRNERTEKAYRNAAKTISSDYEYGQVMRALD